MGSTIKDWLFDPTVGRIVAAFVGVVILGVIIRLVQRWAGRLVKDADTRYRVRKFVAYLGYLAAALLLATAFSNRFGSLTVAFGVAGAGIAFALQEVIASAAGWFAIHFSGFYRVGDRVQLGGIRGDVIDIGALRTALAELGQWVDGDLYNGRIVRVANSFVFKEPVFNYSADYPFLWDEIKVPLKYGCDWRLAREVLERIVQETTGEYAARAKTAWKRVVERYAIEDARVEPMVTLALNDNWMEFTVRYVVDYQARRITKDLLFVRILEEFEASEGKLSIASATFHLVQAPPLEVRLTGGARIPEM
jgi:small-conductance mechanosensitive channel